MRVPKISELIVEEIRTQIVAQRIREGDVLPSESDMVASFGASRPSVREALRVLEFEGLIAIRRGARGGAAVARPNHARTLWAIRRGDPRQAVATWRSHQVASRRSGLSGDMLATAT